MATQHGCLREFHPETDRITSYLERASLYFTANEFPGPKQVAVLLSSIGVPTYALLSDLFGPDKPSSKTFKQISEALVNHYEPQRVIIAERFHFHRKGTRLLESRLQTLTPFCVSWLLTVILDHPPKILSGIDSSVAYTMKLFSAVYSRKRISLTRRRWKLPEQWRPPTPMPSHSRMLDLPSTSSPANQPETETQGIHAITAVALHTYPPTANLKMRLVMTAGRKATYRRYVVLRRSPNNNPR